MLMLIGTIRNVVYLMKLLANRVSTIVREADIEYAELGGAVMALIWGVGLMFVQTRNISFTPQIFGTAFIVIAAVQLFGIRQVNYRIRRIGAMLACAAWMIAAVLSFQAGGVWPIIIGPQCLYFVAASGWAYVRMRSREQFRAWKTNRGQFRQTA